MLITRHSLFTLANSLGYQEQWQFLDARPYVEHKLGIRVFSTRDTEIFYINFSTKQETVFKLKYSEYL